MDNIISIASFHLRNIAKGTNIMSLQKKNAFFASRLDYFNDILPRCSSRCINKLQFFQNAAASLLELLDMIISPLSYPHCIGSLLHFALGINTTTEL